MIQLIKIYKWHLVFWSIPFLGGLAMYIWFQGIVAGVWRSVVMGIPILMMVYGNIEYLIPKLLNRRLFWVYIVLSVVLIVALTYVRTYLDLNLLQRFERWRLIKTSYEDAVLLQYWLSNNFFWYVSLIYSLSTDLSKEKQQKAEIQKQHLEAELKFLKNQLNPHFLLNTLNNIYSMVYRKHDSAAPMLLKLSECMKYLLYECQNDWVDLEDEVRFLENYIELSKMRLDFPERVVFEHKGIQDEQKIPPLLFLAFVENVFKHSDTDDSAIGFAHLCLCVENQKIIFKGKNTILKHKSTLKEKSGIGLQNVKQRLEILFPKKYTLQIQEENQVFSFELELRKSLGH